MSSTPVPAATSTILDEVIDLWNIIHAAEWINLNEASTYQNFRDNTEEVEDEENGWLTLTTTVRGGNLEITNYDSYEISSKDADLQSVLGALAERYSKYRTDDLPHMKVYCFETDIATLEVEWYYMPQ